MIKACILRYSIPGLYGLRFLPGCFDESNEELIPLFIGPDPMGSGNPENLIGHAQINVKDDGVYCDCYINDPAVEKMIRADEDIQYVSFFANYIKDIRNDGSLKDRVITGGRIRGISFTRDKIDTSYIDKELYDDKT